MAVARTGMSSVLTAAVLFLLLATPSSVRAGEVTPEPLQGAADWPMYGATPAHNFSTGAAPPAPLGLVWTLTGNATLGSAVVADGFAYVADIDTVRPPAGPNLVVHRVAAGNGSALARDGAWTQRVLLSNGIALAPSRSLAVDGDRVYALFTANFTTGEGEVLAALETSAGSMVWAFEGTALRNGTSPNATQSAPVLAGDLVIFGSLDGNVYGVNATDGGLVWWFPTGSPVETVPAVDGSIVYVTSGTKLFFLDLAGLANGDQGTPDSGYTGDALLEVDATNAIAASPVVTGDYVYVDAGGAVQAINKTFGGAPVWSTATGGTGVGTPAVWTSWVFSRRSDGRVFAFDRVSGRIEWVQPGLPAPAGGEDLAVAFNRVFLAAGTTTFDLVSLDAAGGDEVDRHSDAARTGLGSPIAAGDVVFVSEGARLGAYRGQPDVAVFSTDITPNIGQVEAGVARGSVRVVIHNVGAEPTRDVVVRVYDGAPAPETLVGQFLVGNASAPLGARGLSRGNATADRDWSVGTHPVWVTIEPVDQETEFANNAAVAFITVRPGPPETIVVGTGPYWAALLLGFLVGVAVLYFPMRRLRELRRKERESETEPSTEPRAP